MLIPTTDDASVTKKRCRLVKKIDLWYFSHAIARMSINRPSISNNKVLTSPLMLAPSDPESIDAVCRAASRYNKC